MIAPANREQIPALKKLWKACFHDHDSYVDFIFRDWQRDMLVLTEHGVAEAMLSVQEFTLRLGGANIPAAYIYAVATTPGRQSAGLGTALLEEANRLLEARGCRCSALVPASERLFEYYGKRGYENAFWLNRAEVLGDDIAADSTWDARQSDFVSVLDLSDRFYADKDAAVWPREYLAFVGEESRYYGGGVIRLEHNGQPAGYAVGYLVGGSCLVKELAVAPEDIPGAMAAVHRHFRAERYRIYLPADTLTDFKNRILPFGMIRWYDKGAAQPVRAYLTHALD